ncbi:hypothetical protein [Hymenobacter sedentarius]|uniref:hypothetical protein n=1 Tax=Hymenobacter sedentarius TaxID=1411621 RepID=UPI000A865573|nr:hypothetical protein [Hymenobacter sedentarius]
MLTPFQFSQLAATAWCGPALTCHFASVQRYVASSGYITETYHVSYHAGEGQQHVYQAGAPCPFVAILQAVAAFAERCTVPLLGATVQGHAARIVSAAEQAFSGAPAPAPVPVPEVVCAECGEGRDAFGQCRCYVPAPHLVASAA